MRFVVVVAPTLQELARMLNDMSIGTGKPIGYSVNKAGEYEALIDMNPTHVVTNDDLWVNDEVDDNMTVLAA